MTADTVVGPVLVHAVPGVEPGGSAPRDLDAVDELCLRMAHLCASAVDALEIAAALEAEAGLTTTLLRTRYGCHDVFALADEMYRRTACRPVEPPPQAEPWAADGTAHVVHGLLYGLPALCYAVAAPLLNGVAPLTVLIVSMLTSWTLGQGLAYLGYRRLGHDAAAAKRLLRVGFAACAAVLLAALGSTHLLAPVPVPVLLFAGAQGVYLLAATVLLIVAAERWLLLALAPGMVAGAGYLLSGGPAAMAELLWLPLVVSALLATGFAAVRTAGPAPADRRVFVAAELRGAVPHALFGLFVAGLLTFPVAVLGFGKGEVVSEVAILTLPLSLSMGAAEWSLYGYRRHVQALLQRCRTPRRFTRQARRVLLAAVARYVAAAAALLAATLVVVVAAGSADPTWTVLTSGLSYLALGAALFVALLLQALVTGAATGLACACALGVEAVLVLGLPTGWAVPVVPAQLLVSACLFVGLLVRSCAVLARVDAHI